MSWVELPLWLALHKYLMTFPLINPDSSSGDKADAIASIHSIVPWL